MNTVMFVPAVAPTSPSKENSIIAPASEVDPHGNSPAAAGPAASVTEGGKDPSAPLEWSSTRRWAILIALSCISLIVNMTLVICAPASSAIDAEFNNSNGFLSVFYITVPNLGQVISPLYIGPLSERYGRVPICHIFNLLFVLFTMASGFSRSFTMVIVFRFLAGASIASITLNPAITGDLFPRNKRGSAMAITSMIPILGSAVGPITGGYLTQYFNWRWTFWTMAIAGTTFSFLLAAVLRETYRPVIRRRALRKLGEHQTAVQAKTQPGHLNGWSLASIRSIARLAVRPFTILSSSRVGVLMAVYLSVLFAYVSLIAATQADIFQSTYGFSTSQSGLIYISLTIGVLAGALYCRFTVDYFLLRGFSRQEAADETQIRAENRLIPIIPAMIAFPIGLVVYGWSLQQHVHWIVPTLATALCGFSLSSSTTPIMSYIVDIFGDRSASAVAAVLPLRYVAGAFMPIAAPYMYERLGYGWGNSLLAFILLALAVTPLVAVAWPDRLKAITQARIKP